MCKHDPPTPPLAAAFDSLTDAQRAAVLDLLTRLIAALTPRPYALPGGNFPPAPDLPPMPPYSEGGAS